MLRVVGDEATQEEVDGRSLLDEIAREGARRMLVPARPVRVSGVSGPRRGKGPSCGLSAVRSVDHHLHRPFPVAVIASGR
jgi:hypothetical protein